jgi:hypothetical protein
MKKITFYLLLLCPILFSNCAATKYNGWLKSHQTELNRIANDANMNGEQKMDALVSTYTLLMNQGLDFTNPVKGVRYIEKFQNQNKVAIDKILGESSAFMNNMNEMQTATFALRAVQKPYIRQLIDLVPKFKRKYEQYKMVAELTSKLAGGFGKLGSRILRF